jgi:hypothetical protein
MEVATLIGPPAEMPVAPYESAKDSRVVIIAARRNVFESSQGVQTRCDDATAGSGPAKGFVSGREGDWRECIIRFHCHRSNEFRLFKLIQRPKLLN